MSVRWPDGPAYDVCACVCPCRTHGLNVRAFECVCVRMGEIGPWIGLVAGCVSGASGASGVGLRLM